MSPAGSTWRDATRLAVGTLTTLRIPVPDVVDRRAGGRAMLLAPVVGAGLGTLAAAVAWAALRVGVAATPAAVLALGAMALTTRGLHLDGLADTADGLAASYDRERALAVMRRGDVGPAGVATVALVLLLQVAALAQVLAHTGPWALVVVGAASRTALPVACLRGIPAARPDGLGATVSGTVSRGPATLEVLLVGLGGAAVLVAAHGVWWHAPVASIAALAVVGVLLRRAVGRLGGVTGDVLGAAVETAAAATLVVLAALGTPAL